MMGAAGYLLAAGGGVAATALGLAGMLGTAGTLSVPWVVPLGGLALALDPLGGFFLASLVPNISQRIHWVIAVVILLSFLPPLIGALRARSRRSGKPGAPPPVHPERVSSPQ